jgi:DNA-binding beta-propeller fold protein YncE
MDPVNGDLIWETPTVEISTGSGEMAINNANNKGYTLETEGGVSFIWATDLSTGMKLYDHVVEDITPGGNVPQSALMVGNNGIIYVHLTEDNIAAFSDDGTQLNLLWQTGITGNAPFSLMASGADGSVYAPSGGKIIRLDGLTGALLNESVSITQGGYFIPRITAAGNGMIYVTNGEQFVYAFDQSLNLIWSSEVAVNNTSGVSIASNGIAVVGGSNQLMAFFSEIPNTVSQIDASEFTVFPNPARDLIHVRVDSDDLGAMYTIRDCAGRIVETGTFQQSINTLHVPQLSAGVYMLYTDSRAEGARFVVE